MDVMREYLVAKEEHERALAALGDTQQQVELARSELADARLVELQMEEELERAAAKVAAGLQELHLGDESDAGAVSATAASALTGGAGASTVAVVDGHTPVLPVVADFLVEYHRNIGCYHCYVFVKSGGYEQLKTTQFKIQVAFPVVKLFMKTPDACAAEEGGGSDAAALGELWWSTEIERNVELDKCVITIKVSESLDLPLKSHNVRYQPCTVLNYAYRLTISTSGCP